MPITEADIAKVAQLAHLELAPEELKTFGPQIAEIVAYVEQLNELDTANVEPAIGGLTPEGEQTDSSRDDEIEGSLGQKTALAEAPDAASGHFRVPKVL
jgi:aspartyl-tRNA(Asn)/glutamyl-tRNA(Gln) amidotransferase subunit C